VLISPKGEEIERVPATSIDNARQEVPFDFPASVAFLGESALVTNQSFPVGNPRSWAVFDLFAGEPGLDLFRPLAAARPKLPRIRLFVAPRRVRAGRRVRYRFHAVAAGHGVARARLGFGGRRARADRHGRAAITVRLSRPGRRLARVKKGGFRRDTAVVRVLGSRR
jgi:hypothetical protein